jgi:hypothetical protein
MDRHELGVCVRRETVPSGPASLFHYPDPMFDLGFVIIGTHQVDHRTTWHGFSQGLERCKFTVKMYHSDVETML